MGKARILEIISKSPKFRNPPARLIELAYLSFNPNATTKDIYRLVSDYQDQIIKITQSNFYNLPPKTSGLRTIVSALHPKDLRNIIFALWLMEFESAGRYDALDYSYLKQYWVLSAVFSQTLGKFLGVGESADLFLQGMLQDISKLALARCVPEIYERLTRISYNTRQLEAEEEKISGICHADISAEIISGWQLPEAFVAPVRLHHRAEEDPQMGGQHKLAAQIISFSARMADLVIQTRSALPYGELENRFTRYFTRPAHEFPNFIRMALENAKAFASPLGLRKMPNFTGLRVLIENPEFLKRRLIPYEELLDELVVVYEKMEALEEELEKNIDERMALQMRDVLTGLCNHAFFQEMLNQEVAKAKRYGTPLSLIIFDVDHFQLFNNAYGIATGNAILQEISAILQKNLREADTIARYGGDEFAIMIPHTARVRATVVAEKLRKRIDEHTFPNPQRDLYHRITVSVGFHTLNPQVDAMDKKMLIDFTLAGLRMAKEAGGNCCKSVDLVRSMGVNAK